MLNVQHYMLYGVKYDDVEHVILASDIEECLVVVAAPGLGQYVEALVRKGGAEFNVRHPQKLLAPC